MQCNAPYLSLFNKILKLFSKISCPLIQTVVHAIILLIQLDHDHHSDHHEHDGDFKRI